MNLKDLAPLLTDPKGNQSRGQKTIVSIAGVLAIWGALEPAYGLVRIVYDAWDTFERTEQVIVAAPGIVRRILELILAIPWPVPTAASVIVLLLAVQSAGINLRVVLLQLLLKFEVARAFAEDQLTRRGYQFVGLQYKFPTKGHAQPTLPEPFPGRVYFSNPHQLAAYGDVSQFKASAEIKEKPTSNLNSPVSVLDLATLYGYKPSTMGAFDFAKLDSLVQHDYKQKPKSTPSKPR